MPTDSDLPVVVRYRASANPKKEEKAIIRQLVLSGVRLLNCLPRYDYLEATDGEERIAVQRFCDILTGNVSSTDLPVAV